MGLFNRRNKEEVTTTEVVEITESEDRSFSGPDPWPLPIRGYVNSLSGTTVNEASTLGIPAAWRAVNLLAENISQLPLHAQRNGSKIETPSLLLRPNPQETRVETIYQIVYSLVLRGNAYCMMGGYDRLGYPQAMVVLNPDQVRVQRNNDGTISYFLGSQEFNQHEIMHITYNKLPGAICGVGVVEAQREGLGHAIAINQYGQRFFSEGATHSGIVRPREGGMTQDEADAIKQSFMQAAGGGYRGPVVIGPAYEFTTVSWNNKDSQFLESKEFSLKEIALIFRVPSYYLGAAGASMTYSNISQEKQHLLDFSLAPIMIRIEQALSDFLPRGTEAKFNADAYLRMDTTARYAAHTQAVGTPWMTINEARALEDLPPIEGGDVLPGMKKEEPKPVQEEPQTDEGEPEEE